MGYNVADRVQGKRLEIRNGMAGERIVVDRKKQAMYVPPVSQIRVRSRGSFVYVLMGTKQLELTIPVAVKVGFALAKNGGACMYLGDVVTFEVGGEEMTLLPATAVQLGGVMMLKADKADDFQRDSIRRST